MNKKSGIAWGVRIGSLALVTAVVGTLVVQSEQSGERETANVNVSPAVDPVLPSEADAYSQVQPQTQSEMYYQDDDDDHDDDDHDDEDDDKDEHKRKDGHRKTKASFVAPTTGGYTYTDTQTRAS